VAGLTGDVKDFFPIGVAENGCDFARGRPALKECLLRLADCDCHVKPDLVLIDEKADAEDLRLVRLGSHSARGW
jgi:hypothetical protein